MWKLFVLGTFLNFILGSAFDKKTKTKIFFSILSFLEQNPRSGQVFDQVPGQKFIEYWTTLKDCDANVFPWIKNLYLRGHSNQIFP